MSLLKGSQLKYVYIVYVFNILCTESWYKQQDMYIKVWNGCRNIGRVLHMAKFHSENCTSCAEGALQGHSRWASFIYAEIIQLKLSSRADPWSQVSWLYRVGSHLTGHSGDERRPSATAFFWLDEGDVAVRVQVPDGFVKPLFEPGTRGKLISASYRSILHVCLVQITDHVLQWHAYFMCVIFISVSLGNTLNNNFGILYFILNQKYSNQNSFSFQ